MADYFDVDQAVAELKAAGWTCKTSYIWKAPDGSLHMGPAGAYRTMKASVGRLFPGEQAAIRDVCEYGEQFGYGNLIHHLKNAWSESIQRKHGMSADTADRASGHVCVWCDVDSRTGKKFVTRVTPDKATR
jgi:hypothetical protein